MTDPAQPQHGARARLRWLPDALTLSRIPMAVACWWVIQDPWWTLGLMALAGISDMLDGFAARKLGVGDERGAWLDPLCDKAFVLSLLAALGVVVGTPWWYLALIATREIIQVPLVIAYKIVHRLRPELRFNFHAGIPGKAATVAQFAAVLAIVLRVDALPLVIVAAALGAIAAAHYMIRAARIARAGSKTAGAVIS